MSLCATQGQHGPDSLKEKALRSVAPVSPGEMLEEAFLKPLGRVCTAIAKEAIQKKLAAIQRC